MTLQQLRFLAAIVESDCNITAAAMKLSVTQPALSRQLLLLESELGFQIFSRHGRGLSRITDAGQQVIGHARRALREAQNISNLSAEVSDPRRGELRIGSTHTEARYVLPNAIQQFRPLFPGVWLSLLEGTPEQLADLASLNRVDLVITADSRDLFENFAFMPCCNVNRCVVVAPSHALATSGKLSLKSLGMYPLALHVSAVGEVSLQESFAAAKVTPRTVLTTRDAEMVKAYVRLGLGVGIIPDVAFDSTQDTDLVALDVAHLFPPATSWAGFSRETVLRQYTYEFLNLLAPHLSRETIHLNL
jgi:LysR family transcriptional regulator, cys regulon transcriptional activator